MVEPEIDPDRRRADELRRRLADQRAVVRWWAAECRARNALCRACFTAAHVAAAGEARRTLRLHAAAWTASRAELRALELAPSSAGGVT